MRNLNLNALKMFDAAARHLNFRVAAEEMNLTQGAVAQQVRGLEAGLGVMLFRRKARGLELTEIGERYHVEVLRALLIIRDATQKLQPNTKQVTISVPPSLASKWLVPKLPYFMEMHPGIEVRTIASEKRSNFTSDDVDIAIRQGARPTDDNLYIALLSPHDFRAVCSTDYAKDTGNIGEVSDFSNHHLIQDGHRLWNRLFEGAGLEVPQQMLQFNQTALAMDAAANGQGIALAPNLLLGNEIEQGRLVEIWRDDRSIEGGYYLVYPLADAANAKARTFLANWLLSECSVMHET